MTTTYESADHHGATPRSEEQAGKQCDARHFVRAADATKLALDHGRHPLFHDDQSEMHRLEHYGSLALAELA